MLESFAQVVEQIDDKIASIKCDIKATELYLHKQLNAGVPEEHLSDYYELLDTNEGMLCGLNEALSILKATRLNYTERAL